MKKNWESLKRKVLLQLHQTLLCMVTMMKQNVVLWNTTVNLPQRFQE